jgi:uncharacterized phiE125 gp8 family phage protein
MLSRWSLKLVTAPTLLAVSPAEAKAQARVDIDDDDLLLERKIRAATEAAQVVQNRALLTSTWRLSMDYFPCWEIRLPMPPLQSVTSITYVDSAGSTQTLSASTYIVDTDAEPGRVTPAYGLVWPSVRVQPGSVKITYIAGYTAASLIPETTREDILVLAASRYEHRESAVVGTIGSAIPGFEGLFEAEAIRDFSGPFGGE